MAKRNASSGKVKISEPPLMTLADVVGTDVESVLVDVPESDNELRSGVRRFDLADIQLAGGFFMLPDTLFWRKMSDYNVVHVFPVTYEPPPLPAEEPRKPWYRKLAGV